MPPHFSYLRMKKYLKVANIVAFTSLITLILIRFMKTPSFSKKSYSFKILKSEEKTIVSETLKKAFDTYLKYCSDYDEVFPASHQCKNSQGFYASAVESLEVLYLLGMKEEFSKAKKIVLNNLIPEKIQWVNRKSFWNKCIGSLIGIYTLTGDSSFLEKAILFSEKIFSMQTKTKYAQYLNFKTGKVMKDEWLNNTVSLSDLTAGLPELLVLHNLTGANKYLTVANQIISHFPDLSKTYGHYYSIKTGQIMKEPLLYQMDGHIIDAYNSLLRAYLIRPIPTLLKKIEAFQFNVPGSNSILQSSALLETQRLMQLIDQEVSIDKFETEIVNKLSDFEIENIENNKEIIGFNFEGEFLRALLFNDKQEEFESIYFKSFDKLEYGDGFSGLMHTSSGRWLPTGIQNSEFFGQWIKLGVEYLLSSEPEIKNAVVNSNGHILMLGSSS